MFGLLGKKRRHFKARLDSIQSVIFDLEFNRAKLKMIREQMRLQYDRIRETSTAAQQALEAERQKEQPNQETIAHLEKVVEKYTPDLQYLEKQMNGMDNSIDCENLDEKGNPIGINQRIEAARVMKDMLTEYIRTL